jgi:hypothetical protein
MNGYHLSKIEKGTLGSSSKIKEELDELLDAEVQCSKIMILLEASDLYGALEAYIMRFGMTMEDLAKMSEITARAFSSGERK